MNFSDSPKKQSVPFAINGQREEILATTPAGDNTASYDSGFPPVTMILKAAGGLPPKGQDMNQILYELSNLSRWFSAGALNAFDSSFSTAVGGYPKGAVLINNSASNIFISTIDANTNNPNSVSTGWLGLLSFLGGAPLASPALTGIPTAPTAAAGTNTTQLATTAFVLAMAASGIATTGGKIVIPALISGSIVNFILQWGVVATISGSGPVTFPTSFPSALLASWVCENNSSAWVPGSNSGCAVYGIDSKTKNGMRIASLTYTGSTWQNLNASAQWFALGY